VTQEYDEAVEEEPVEEDEAAEQDRVTEQDRVALQRVTMDDSEYEEFVVALARKYLRLDRLQRREELADYQLIKAMERLSSTSRVLRAVQERAEMGENFSAGQREVPIYAALGHETHRDAEHARFIHDYLRDSGVLEALDNAPELLLSNLRRTAIPNEDLALLQRCGVEDPEAEITLLIHTARAFAFTKLSPSEAMHRAAERLFKEGRDMENSTPPPAPKKRKTLNGIGNLLTGFVTAGGNALLATGTILAPNPATGFATIASAAMAAGSIFKGLGDLRGE
jgi:hypothetical protein